MPKYPFSKPLPYIPSKDELIRVVVSRYKTVEAPSPTTDPGFIKLRRLEIVRIKTTSDYLIKIFRDVAMNMPFLDSLHPFYRDLINLLLDERRYRHSLAKVAHAPTAIKAIERDALFIVRTAGSRREILKARRMYIGRIIDLIEDLSPELEYLRESVRQLKRLPNINPELYTIVVAGMPNVGKSSLVRAVSTAKPEVADYPFTTKQIHVGHISLFGESLVQIVDTPGLLDKPLTELSKIELQAVLALRHLARVIVFLVDPTLHSGYELERQLRLLQDVRESFSNVPVVVAINKIDIASKEQIDEAEQRVKRLSVDLPVYKISCINAESARSFIMDVINRFIVPLYLEKIKVGKLV